MAATLAAIDVPVVWTQHNLAPHAAPDDDELYEALSAVRDDREVRTLVLRGAGEEAFVAGTDIKQFLEFESGEDGIAYEERLERVIGRLHGHRRLRRSTLMPGAPVAIAARATSLAEPHALPPSVCSSCGTPPPWC